MTKLEKEFGDKLLNIYHKPQSKVEKLEELNGVFSRYGVDPLSSEKHYLTSLIVGESPYSAHPEIVIRRIQDFVAQWYKRGFGHVVRSLAVGPTIYTPEPGPELSSINARLKEDLTRPFYVSRDEFEKTIRRLETELPEKVLDLMIIKGYVFKKKE